MTNTAVIFKAGTGTEGLISQDLEEVQGMQRTNWQ
jgi:hypothetical protein